MLGAIAGELVTIHGQTDQLKIAASSRQREFLDRVAGDEAELAAYRKAWDALAAMDERLERCARRNPLPANRPTTCANPSTASTESTRSRGRMRS